MASSSEIEMEVENQPSPATPHASSASSSAAANLTSSSYDVFINYCGPDMTSKIFASHLYHLLLSHGFRPFLDNQGLDFPSQIEPAIQSASVHVAVFSPNYADSEWCLRELLLMLESRAPIIPVFYHVQPADLRWTGRDKTGVYAEALHRLQLKKTYCSQTHQDKPRYDPATIQKWRDALSSVADKSGFDLDGKFNGDEGEMLHKLLERVEEMARKRAFHVFINYCGRNTKKTFASHLYHLLLSHGFRPFLDHQEWQEGLSFHSQREHAIRSASVHVAVFSPNYAESEKCLRELLLMVESRTTIIPVFYHVHPTDVRWTGEDKTGVYAQALHRLQLKKTGDVPRYDPATIQKWRRALSRVAHITGFNLDMPNGDEGEMLNKLVESVEKKMALDVFINYRGLDTKKTFASRLYHVLISHGFRPFLDQEELEEGFHYTSQIEHAIRSARVHVAVFSPNYADSEWCLSELLIMLESGAPIIPVFYHVQPADVRYTGDDHNGVYAEALRRLQLKKTYCSQTHQYKPRYDPATIQKWRRALSSVANISGFYLDVFDGDEGEMLNKLVESVEKMATKTALAKMNNQRLGADAR